MSLTKLTGCLNFSLGNRQQFDARALPAFIFMTDEKRLADPLPVVRSLPENSAVILRHYDLPGREDLAIRLVALGRQRGVRILIAGDARLAHKVGADGLHMPEYLVARGPGRWWTWRRPDWLVTAAAHSLGALFRAARSGADAALLAPVFQTASHPDSRPLGCLMFTAWCRKSPLPVYALGGVSETSQRRLKGSGAAGLAGIGGFLP